MMLSSQALKTVFSVLVALLIGCLLILAPRADARPFRVGVLPEKAGALGCKVCHVDPKGGGPRNAFGKDYEKLAIPAKEKITDALAAADSDGDGVANGEELRSGKLPGDPGSKP
jgi:hypothetical protein